MEELRRWSKSFLLALVGSVIIAAALRVLMHLDDWHTFRAWAGGIVVGIIIARYTKYNE